MFTKTADVTEQEATKYFHGLFNANFMPMSMWKYDGTLTSANDSFLDMIGYSRADFEAGKVNWREITPPGYEKNEEACVHELKTQGCAKPLIKEFTCKDGSRVKLRINNIVINKTDDHGLAIFFPI